MLASEDRDRLLILSRSAQHGSCSITINLITLRPVILPHLLHNSPHAPCSSPSQKRPLSGNHCSMRAFRLQHALRSISRNSHPAATATPNVPQRLDFPMTSAFTSSSTSPHPTSSSTTSSASPSPLTSLPIDDTVTHQFGPHIRLSGRQVFFLTPLSLASVNLSPVVAGHALVLTRRVVERMSDMTAAEVSDCWLLAQLVGRMLTARLGATSLTYAVQDGAEAGQSVPHVHVHVMPRRKGDFGRSDDIYGEMEKPEHSLAQKEEPAAVKAGQKGESSGAGKPHMDEDRRRRTTDEMAAEATLWRRYMQETLQSSINQQR